MDHKSNSSRYGATPLLLCLLLLISITSVAQEKKPGDLIWEFETGGLHMSSSPSIGVDGTVYFGSGDSRVYAVDGKTGAKQWDFFAGEVTTSSPAIGSDGSVYIGSLNGIVYALDGKTGSKKWEFRTGDKVIASPAIGGDETVYIGSWNGKLYALNGSTGAKKWEYLTGTGDRWVRSSAAIGADGTVYFGSSKTNYSNGILHALDGITGAEKWQFPTGQEPNAPVIGGDGTIYFACCGFGVKLFALDGSTVTKKWELALGGPARPNAAIGVDGTVYVGSGGNKVHALNGSTGAKKWESTVEGQVIAASAIGSDGTVYVGAKKVYALDGSTGAKKWEFEMGNAAASSPAIGTDGILYIGSHGGKVYALKSSSTGPASSPWPMFGQNAQRTSRQFSPPSPPKIVTPPTGQMLTVGSTVTLSILAEGTKPLSFQWYKDGKAIEGAITSSLQLDNVTKENAGTYFVEVKNNFGKSVSNDAELVVMASSITLNPQDKEVLQYENVKFEVQAAGKGPFSYQWKHNGNNIGDATENPFLVIENVQRENSGEYKVSVINQYGVTESKPFQLIVKPLGTNFIVNDVEVKNTEIVATGSAVISVYSDIQSGEIFYTLDGTQPTFTSSPYLKPFVLTESATIRVIAYSADFTRSAESKPVEVTIIPVYTMRVDDAGGGTVMIDPPSGPYAEGTEVTVTAMPEGDWDFIGWSGDSTSSDAVITITMDGPKALAPTFGTNVILNEIGEGQVVQTPANPVPYGSTVKFTAKPNNGHYFFRWAFFRWGGEQEGNDNPVRLQITKAKPVVSGLFTEIDPSLKPDTSIWEAVQSGNIEIVKLHIASGTDINLETEFSDGILFDAITKEHIQIVELLIANGADVNFKDYYRWSPLHAAVEMGSIEIAELLIVSGAAVNAQDIEMGTPLDAVLGFNSAPYYSNEEIQKRKLIGKMLKEHGAKYGSMYAAAFAGDLNVLNELLTPVASLNVVRLPDGKSALRGAVDGGHKEIVELLVEKGADVEGSMYEWLSPLEQAVSLGHKEIVEFLISKGADVNNTLIHAIDSRDIEFFEFLISKGADVNNSVMNNAAYRGNIEIVKVLIAKGFDIDAYGRDALYAAVSANHVKTAALLIENGADVNVLGATSNIWHSELIHLLISNGANVNQKIDNWGLTALDAAIDPSDNLTYLIRNGAKSGAVDSILAAAFIGDVEAVKQHLNNGVDVNTKNEDGNTPLHVAAWKGHKEIAKLLIARGAGVGEKNKEDETPLFFIISKSWDWEHKATSEIVELLITSGADVNVKNRRGTFLLQDAIRYCGNNIIELLINAGADVNAKIAGWGTLLDWGIFFQRNNTTIDLLVKHGAKSGDEDSIVVAFDVENINAFKEHLINGADPNYKIVYWGGDEVTLLSYVLDSYYYSNSYERLYDTEYVELLLSYGADLNVFDYDGYTCLMRAIENKNIEFIELFIDNGADINAKNIRGETALHCAARWFFDDQKKYLELLLAKGADVNAIITTGPDRGHTPLDLAVGEIADTIRKNGGKTGIEMRALMPRLVQHGRFAFSFDAKEGRVYEVQDSFDLLNWEVIKTYTGTGTAVRFDEERDHDPPKWFYRVRVGE